MLHKNILDNFKIIFPHYAGSIDVWFPSGKDKIRVRLSNGHEFIFSYMNESDWCLETVDRFIKHM